MLPAVFSSAFAEGTGDTSRNNPDLNVDAQLEMYEYDSDSDLEEVEFASEKDATPEVVDDPLIPTERSIVKVVEPGVTEEHIDIISDPSISTPTVPQVRLMHEVLHDRSTLITGQNHASDDSGNLNAVAFDSQVSDQPEATYTVIVRDMAFNTWVVPLILERLSPE